MAISYAHLQSKVFHLIHKVIMHNLVVLSCSNKTLNNIYIAFICMYSLLQNIIILFNLIKVHSIPFEKHLFKIPDCHLFKLNEKYKYLK